MIKQIAITAAAVIIGLIAYELGKNLLGLNSYEEDFERQ